MTRQNHNHDTVDPATSRVSSARLDARRRRVRPRQMNLVGIASANYWQRIDRNAFLKHWYWIRFASESAVEDVWRMCVDHPRIAARTIRATSLHRSSNSAGVVKSISRCCPSGASASRTARPPTSCTRKAKQLPSSAARSKRCAATSPLAGFGTSKSATAPSACDACSPTQTLTNSSPIRRGRIR